MANLSHENYIEGDFVGAGSTGIVTALSDTAVMKSLWDHPQPDDFQAFLIERNIFKLLLDDPIPHPNIVRCLAITEDRIILERLREDLYSYLRRTPPGEIRNEERARWAAEAASGLHYLHSKRILHSDISTYNILLDENLHLKWIDFAGSSLNGAERITFYSSRSVSPRCEGDTVTLDTEIFAFGCVLYEIETGHVPYPDLEYHEVDERYKTNNFPSLAGSFLGAIIMKCWAGHYEDMAVALKDILNLSVPKLDERDAEE